MMASNREVMDVNKPYALGEIQTVREIAQMRCSIDVRTLKKWLIRAMNHIEKDLRSRES